ncbi:uncharacterized protein LOC114593894 isoform X3 [Podarcis muralis]
MDCSSREELKAKHTSSILASQPCEIGNFFENKDIHTLIRSGKAFPNCASHCVISYTNVSCTHLLSSTLALNGPLYRR